MGILPAQPERKPDADTISCTANKIETLCQSCRSLRIMFDKNKNPIAVLWLSNPTFRPHTSTMSLYSYLTDKSSPKMLVAPETPDHFRPDGFLGLYTEFHLLENPFVERKGNGICLSTQSLWQSRTELVSVAVSTVNETHASLGGFPLYNWNLLASDDHRSVVCSRSTPTSPLYIVLLTIEGNGSFGASVVTSLKKRPQEDRSLYAPLSSTGAPYHQYHDFHKSSITMMSLMALTAHLRTLFRYQITRVQWALEKSTSRKFSGDVARWTSKTASPQ